MSLFLPRRGGFRADNEMHRSNIRALEAWAESRAQFIIKRKITNETVTNSTTMQDDDDLFFEVKPNEIWAVQGGFFWTQGNAAGGQLKMEFTVPTNCVGKLMGSYPTSNAAITYQNFVIDPDEDLVCQMPSTDEATVIFMGTIANLDTPGNFRIRWAQNTASGFATTIYAQSYLIAHKQAIQEI